MTLVGMFNRDGRTVAVADVLLTSKDQYTRLDIPTRDTRYEYTDPPEALPSGFVQKVVFISSKVVFCWAGNRHQAHLLAEYLKKQMSDISQIPDLLASYPAQDRIGEGPGKVCGVLSAFFNSHVSSIDIGLRAGRRKVGRFEEAWLFGSGLYDAEDMLQVTENFGQEEVDPIFDALVMVGHLTAAQSSSGHGLEDAWGGGFQIVCSSEHGFEFLDRVLIRAWVVTGSGPDIKLERGPFFFYFYVEEMLIMCRPWGGDGGSLFFVPPLLKPNYEIDFQTGERKALHVLDMIRSDNDDKPVYYMAKTQEQNCASSVWVAPKGSYVSVTERESNEIKSSYLKAINK